MKVMLLENSSMAFTIVIVSSIQFQCLYAGEITWSAHRPLRVWALMSSLFAASRRVHQYLLY